MHRGDALCRCMQPSIDHASLDAHLPICMLVGQNFQAGGIMIAEDVMNDEDRSTFTTRLEGTVLNRCTCDPLSGRSSAAKTEAQLNSL